MRACVEDRGADVNDDDLFKNSTAWPPGFRFHPTDEELVLYYLKRKICKQRLKLDVIREVDVYKWDPEELPGQSILKNRDRQWYFFSTRERKYPNASRSNRATRQGYWKTTGKDRIITWNSRAVGVKKTLVFHKGRAPSGERTDWVMHEYTMEENELQRCKNVQDYYALCKLFKKSGPGPKNGEQYGAPFREEDWADEDEVIENRTPDKVTQGHKNGYVCVENTSQNNSKPLVDDIDELFQQIAEEAELYTPPNKGNALKPSQIGVKEETLSTIMRASNGESISFEPLSWHPYQDQSDARDSFIASQSTVSYLQSFEAPEVTSASKNLEWNSLSNEGMNYLEINDLVGSQNLEFSNMNGVCDKTQFEREDVWHESDIFFDADMFLQDSGPINQNLMLEEYISGQDNGAINQSLMLEEYISGLGGDLSNQESGQKTTLVSGENQVTDELWIQDSIFNLSAPAELNQAARLPTTGGSMNHTEESHNWNHNENGDIDSWFSSSISALLDSVPARPALAAESKLINRAFHRMSSFSRLKASAIDLGLDARGKPVEGSRFRGNMGLIFFSVLGVLCAVLFMWKVGAMPENLNVL